MELIELVFDVTADVVAVRGGTLFGESEDGAIFLDDVVCSGGESSLLDCGHGGVRQHNCMQSETAGVICGGNMVHSVVGVVEHRIHVSKCRFVP